MGEVMKLETLKFINSTMKYDKFFGFLIIVIGLVYLRLTWIKEAFDYSSFISGCFICLGVGAIGRKVTVGKIKKLES